MGRRKKPTLMKLVENSRERRAPNLVRGEPIPSGEVEAPVWLSDGQRAAWDFAVENAPLGLLKRIDTVLLIAWVVAAEIHKEASIKLANSSLLIRDKNGNVQTSPYERVVRQQTVVLKTLAADLGFSPAARTSIAVDHENEEDEIALKYFK